MARGCWYATNMAKRDPFGRLPDENPLAGLGAMSDGTASQAGQPVVVAADDDWSGGEPGVAQARPSATEQPAARPAMSASSAPPQQRPPNPMVDQSLAEVIRQAEAMSGVKVVQSVKVVGRVVKLVVFLVVIGAVFGVAKPIFDAGKDVKDAFSDLPSADKIADDTSPPAVPGSSQPEKSSAEPKVPSGLSSNSMLVRRNFSRAMTRLRNSGLGRMRSMSVRPERIDAQLLTKGGSLRSVQIKSGESEISKFGASGGGFSQLETIPFSKIDAAAPARLARSAAGRLRKPVSQIDYVVLLSFAGDPLWSAFSKTGKHFQANVHGRITRRVN
jgi:hypothetical protein